MSNHDRIQKDPLALIIVEITKAMKADFGRQYQAQFKTDDDMTQYKRRLYAKLRGIDINDIADGYELYVDAGKTFCPGIPELLDFIRQAEKSRKQNLSNLADADRVAALPAPSIECNPLQILAEAKQSAIACAARDMSMAEKLKAHDALLTLHAHHIKRRDFNFENACAVSYCKLPGGLSHNTKGGGPFYCREHYRQAG